MGSVRRSSQARSRSARPRRRQARQMRGPRKPRVPPGRGPQAIGRADRRGDPAASPEGHQPEATRSRKPARNSAEASAAASSSSQLEGIGSLMRKFTENLAPVFGRDGGQAEGRVEEAREDARVERLPCTAAGPGRGDGKVRILPFARISGASRSSLQQISPSSLETAAPRRIKSPRCGGT